MAMHEMDRQGVIYEADRQGVIKVDRITLLTGIMGLGFLMVCWTAVLEGPMFLTVLGYEFVTSGIGGSMAVFGIIVILFIVGAIFGVARWIARGFLDGRKRPAIVGASLMLVWAALMAASSILTRGDLNSQQNIPMALAAMIFALLAFGSLRNKSYWRTRR
jgi:hypothetical protein